MPEIMKAIDKVKKYQETMENSLSVLRNLVNTFQPLSDDEWLLFSHKWQPFSCKRKEVITNYGDVEKYLYFVIEGVQRVFYADEKDREATLIFTYAPSFGGVIDSMVNKTPSKYYYESLTPSRFLKIQYADIEGLAHRIPAVGGLMQKGLSISLSGLLERMVEIQCFSAEDRYLTMLKRSPHILQLVPHKYLANYLGIDPTNFSKLINRLRI
jgi:CRP-like cAMP-binding protein